MKYVVALLLILTLHQYCISQNLEFSGTITVNTEWDYDTVKVTGDVIVNSGKTLTIKPGTCVEFQGRYSIICNGSLRFVGTSDKKIKLTTNDSTLYDTDLANMGWRGIQLPHVWDGGHHGVSNPNDSSVFKHCIFEYANGGAVEVENFSKVSFSQCVFRKSTGGHVGGIRFYYSHGSVDRCSFFENSGGVIEIWSASPRITNSSFINNNGSSIELTESDSWIEKNIFSHNLAANGGAILIHGYSGVIANNIIANNTVTNGGGAIFGGSGGAMILNNTIVNNKAAYAPGAVLLDAYRFYNTILWNNDATDHDPEAIVIWSGLPIVHNCLIENGQSLNQSLFGAFQNNVYTDPVFFNPNIALIYDREKIIKAWSVDSLSSSVNKGLNTFPQSYNLYSDIDDNPRISNTTMDIGAIEYQFHPTPEPEPDPGDVTATASWQELDAIRIYPNPTSAALNIQVDTGEEITATVFDLRGCLMESRTFFSDTQLNWNSYSSGSYILILKSKDKIFSPRRVVKY